MPVDFERASLAAALEAAGHDPRVATTWVWEGVVMYLTPADVESTLGAIERRSAPDSRLIVVYHAPAWKLRVVGWVLRRIGEPLRSTFTAERMRTLLHEHGFAAIRDHDMHAIGSSLAPDVAQAARPVEHMPIVVADRAP